MQKVVCRNASVDEEGGLFNGVTGIPPHVTLLAAQEKVLLGQKKCVTNMREALREELEIANVGGLGMTTRIEGIFNAFDEKISSRIDRLEISQERADTEGGAREESRRDDSYWHCWGGRFRRVPEDWEFPHRCGLSEIVQRYY